MADSSAAELTTGISHASLYKKSNKIDRTIERRHLLLAEQRHQRQSAVDDLRGLHTLVKSLRHQPNSSGRQRRKFVPPRPSYRNQLQLSEWLRCRPTDFTTNWYMVPCPRGTRCIVVATDGCTDVYSKHGVFQRKFQSKLPGGSCSNSQNRHHLTMLDCVYTSASDEYWILDVLAYGNQSVVNCEASFRFFWIANKVLDDELAVVEADRNECAFKTIAIVDCGDAAAVAECLGQWPMWSSLEQPPQLDGLLFYHKESSYVAGTTPLVGWLYSFMVKEILGFSVCEELKAMAPTGYSGALEYIEQFEADLQTKKNRTRRNRRTERMDAEEIQEDNVTTDIMDAERVLEMEGQSLDDVYY